MLIIKIGKCFSKISNEKQFKGGSFENIAKDFEFEVCPFTHVIQRDVADPQAKPTLLGVWQQWHDGHDDVMVCFIFLFSFSFNVLSYSLLFILFYNFIFHFLYYFVKIIIRCTVEEMSVGMGQTEW